MKKTHYSITLIAALLFSFFVSGQTDNPKEKAEVKFGVFYNSNLNYYGRTDSLKSSGFFPLAELWLNENLYVNAAPVFINNTIQQFEYAGAVTTAGYRFGRDGKDAGNIYLIKPFYNDNSDLVQSALKAQVAGTYSWLNKIINVTAGGDIKFSDRVDYGVTGGLDHIFRFEPGSGFVIVVNPSAYINAGTQQFTKTYYKKSSFLLFPGVEQQVTEEVKGFNILSYEFSSLMIVAKGKFQLIFNPSYIIPKNLIKVEGRPDLSERGENIFYTTIGAKITF